MNSKLLKLIFFLCIFLSIISSGNETINAKDNKQLYPFWVTQNKLNPRYLCGFIDNSGKVVIKAKYQEVLPFSDGVAWVSPDDKKWQLIDLSGKVLINNPNIESPSSFVGGVSQVITTTKQGYESIQNKVYIDINGNVLFKKPYIDEIGPLNNSLMFYSEEKNYSHSKFGFLDLKGNLVIPQNYTNTSSFSEDFAAVSILDESYNIKAGFIDKDGNIVIDLKFDGVGDFINGYAPIAKIVEKNFLNMNEGLIKPSRHITFSDNFPYPTINNLRSGFNLDKLSLQSYVSSVLYGFIDKSGNYIIEPQYDQIQSFREGFAAVSINNKWGYIDPKNNKLTDFIYADARKFKEGSAAVLVTDNFGVNKWGFINKLGKISILPKFDEVGDFNNGLAAVKVEGKWGFVNSKGAYVVKPTYTDVSDFNNGLSLVRYRTKSESGAAYINTYGKIIWKSKF